METNTLLDSFVNLENKIDLAKIKNVVVYRVKFCLESYSDGLYSQVESLMPEVIANSVTKRKAEYLAGRICANEALKRIGIQGTLIGIGKDRLPQWPTLVKGCISHNHNSAIAAISVSHSIRGLGVDIETILPSISIKNIMHRVIDEKEKALLDSGKGRNANEVFTLMFSIKESFFKATYPFIGFHFNFDAVSVELIDYEESVFNVIVNKDLSAKIKKDSVFFWPI